MDSKSVKPAADLEKIPYAFTHNVFRPDTPIMREPAVADDAVTAAYAARVDREQQIIWQLMRFSPLERFKKDTMPKITQTWLAARPVELAHLPVDKVFPTDALSKWSQYDGFIVNVRGSYSLYVPAHDQLEALLMVPDLHTPPTAPNVAVNDADLRFMSLEAFDWCCSHGRVFASADDAVAAVATPSSSRPVSSWYASMCP